jgi:hypothetical protein
MGGTVTRGVRPGQYYYHGWDYVVRSYDGDKFCLETVHRGQLSLDMELAAIARLGRDAFVWRVQPDGRVGSRLGP